MSQRVVRMLLVVALAAAALVGPAQPAHAEATFFGVIVQLAPGETSAALDARHSTTTVREMVGRPGTFFVTASDGRTDAALVTELRADPAVVAVDVNSPVLPPEVTFSGRFYRWSDGAPTTAGDQWAAAHVGIDAAHAVSTGAGQTIAVLDTGLSDPSLASVVLPGIDLVDGDLDPADTANGVDDNANGLADEGAGHGTFVAGIVHLTAPASRILPVRVLDDEGDGSAFTVVQGMYWAADHGANVINMSLGQRGSATFVRKATVELAARGVVVVAAAGNEARRRKQFPAAADCTLGVTSTGRTDAVSDFASYGDWIDVAAPGEDIVSHLPVAPSGTATWSGTSMAAPFVAGEVALVRAAFPKLKVQQVLDRVRSATAPVVAKPNGFGTAGRIDVLAAVTPSTAVSKGRDCTRVLP